MKLSHTLFLIAAVDAAANLAANNLNVIGTPVQATTAGGQQTTLPGWYTSTVGMVDMNLPVQLWLLAGVAGLVAMFVFHK